MDVLTGGWVVFCVLIGMFLIRMGNRRRLEAAREQDEQRRLKDARELEAERQLEAHRDREHRRAEKEQAKDVPPRDIQKEHANLQKWYSDSVFAEITSNVRLTKERVFVGTRKTGERFVGVLCEESQVPADSVDIRPLRDVSELMSALPAEWAMDEDLFDIRLAQGEMLVQVPIQHIPLMEDVHEPVYKDVVHTVYVLLDISGSMFPEHDGTWKVPLWKGVTLKVLFDSIASGASFTLRPFSDRAHPPLRAVSELQALDVGKIVASMGQGGGTDIKAALLAAVGDFEKMTYDTADILIITDGEDETEMAGSLRGILDKKRIKLHAVMLGQKNDTLRACCDSYQIIDREVSGVKLHPVVMRAVQPLPSTA